MNSFDGYASASSSSQNTSSLTFPFPSVTAPMEAEPVKASEETLKENPSSPVKDISFPSFAAFSVWPGPDAVSVLMPLNEVIVLSFLKMM